uniref:Ig-like domain-containing protein n=1 Tax=Gallus gallus TaxID=9031 RepID=A0A8V0XS09_CHICK
MWDSPLEPCMLCLASHGGQSARPHDGVPRPSLSLHPSQGVSLGDTVTLRCYLPQPAAWVWLYQEGGRTHNKYKDKEQDAVEFSFGNTSWKHAGTYRCQYHVSEPLGTSEKSDPVELVLTAVPTGPCLIAACSVTELSRSVYACDRRAVEPLLFPAGVLCLHVDTISTSLPLPPLFQSPMVCPSSSSIPYRWINPQVQCPDSTSMHN